MYNNARTSLTKVSRSASYRLRSDFVLTSFFKTIRYCKTIVLRKRNVMLFLTATVYLSTPKHHLHQMLLYSLQHQLPTRSVLHHDDHTDLPHKVELHCSGKERRNKGITDAHKKGELFESEYEEEK